MPQPFFQVIANVHFQTLKGSKYLLQKQNQKTSSSNTTALKQTPFRYTAGEFRKYFKCKYVKPKYKNRLKTRQPFLRTVVLDSLISHNGKVVYYKHDVLELKDVMSLTGWCGGISSHWMPSPF